MNDARIDGGRSFDWGRTSQDYARYRASYPPAYHETLEMFGIGKPGQRILDIGTGTGVLARALAKGGAEVHAVDLAANQIEEARRLAAEEGVAVRFEVGRAEEVTVAPASLDFVTAAQCWLYFDRERIVPVTRDALKPTGCLVITWFVWLPMVDPVARASEQLVLEHNPAWMSHGHRGARHPVPRGLEASFDLKTFHVVNVDVPFTRETWRGRMRACRGVGASLDAEGVAAFDAAHASLLEKIAPPTFTVRHQISVHILARAGEIYTQEG